MILYSVIPNEVVYQGMESYSPQYEEIEMQGVLMQIERISPNQGKIVRIYSVSPEDYLNPNLSPGTLIAYGPTLVSS